MDMVQCLCTHLTSFAGDFFVMPNAIDWSKISLDNLFSNPTVFAVVMTIFGLYVIGMIWARRKDKEDLLTVRSREPLDYRCNSIKSFLHALHNSVTALLQI